jgi:GntP family gluconate:H+ symporter
MIILITSAGGAFGYALRNAGAAEAVRDMAVNLHMHLVLLAWLVAALIRIAQGSATVAMLTTAAMVEPLLHTDAISLAYHPVYVFLAIGSGAFGFSWMADSGFWIVSRLAGLSERRMLRTFTVVVSAASIGGLIVALLGAELLPLKP